MRATPSYIRTIKPNQNRSASEYDTKAVLHQVKYLGLQENIRVRRAGFAYRNTFEKMIERCVSTFSPLQIGRTDLYLLVRTDSICCRQQLDMPANISGKATSSRAASASSKTRVLLAKSGKWVSLRRSSRTRRRSALSISHHSVS